MKFNDVFNIFLSYKYLRDETVKSYSKVVRQFLNRYPDIDIEDINIDMIIEWRDEALDRIKPITWNNLITHLKAVYNFALKKAIYQ